MRDELLKLARRVEVLDGDDWQTRVDIACALGWTSKTVGQVIAWYAPGDPHMKAGPPNWLASLDAALTLVPEGWWLAGLSFNHADFRSSADREWHAEIAGPVTWAVLDRHVGEEPQFECEGGNATTPALAIAAAALRALASQEPTT